MEESKKTTMTKLPEKSSFDMNESRMENVFIGISGMIGAGKTTLATALAKELVRYEKNTCQFSFRFLRPRVPYRILKPSVTYRILKPIEQNLPVHYEPVTDNVYLADFYKDMSKYAFPLQIYLLNKRFKQQQQIVWNGRGGVQDRTIYEDTVFAKMLAKSGHMSQRDYETYLSLFSNMSHFMKKPNIIVHLDVSPEQSMDRIKMRSRGCESGMSLEYLKALHQAYEEFISDISRVIPVIKVDYSKFPTAEQMAKAIKVQYAEIANIRHVAFNDNH